MAKCKAAGNPVRYVIKVPCPCDYHQYDARWEFNGNFDRPNFNGSMLIKTARGDESYVCHSVLNDDATIRYIDDGTTHELRGKTVPLQDIEDV